MHCTHVKRSQNKNDYEQTKVQIILVTMLPFPLYWAESPNVQYDTRNTRTLQYTQQYTFLNIFAHRPQCRWKADKKFKKNCLKYNTYLKKRDSLFYKGLSWKSGTVISHLVPPHHWSMHFFLSLVSLSLTKLMEAFLATSVFLLLPFGLAGETKNVWHILHFEFVIWRSASLPEKQ